MSNAKLIKAKVVTVAPAKAAKKKVVRVAEAKHDLHLSYAGESLPINKGKSITPVKIHEFNVVADKTLTPRTQDMLNAIKAAYRAAEFERKNLNAGPLSRLIRKGYVQHVSGDAVSPQSKFKLTASALK